MKNKPFWVLGLLVVFLFSHLELAQAVIGQLETKRERREREAASSGESGSSSDKLYQRIHESFLREDYAVVDTLSREYLSRARDRSNAEDVLYLQSLSLLKLNRSEEARVKLSQLENDYASSDARASAHASIADSYYYEGNFDLAYKSYEETITRYPASEQTPYVLSRLIELSAKQDRPKETEMYKVRLLKDYPNSQEVKNFPPSAAPLKQMALEENAFYAVQVGSFSKRRNAQGLIDKLLRDQYDAYLKADESDRMYRVRVGKLSSKEEALVLENRLKKEGYPTKIYP